jgi:two-component system, chemotaxis family, protein-glutamate methylesterase/glutaminase
MKPVGVLVVDANAAARRVVVTALLLRSEIKIVGEVGDARAALEVCARHRPEVVTVDVEMAEGLSILGAIKRAYPLTQVIMFSAASERGASATLKALALGAVDFLTKPSGSSSDASVRRLAAELTNKVLAAGKRRRGITANLMIAELAKSPERLPEPGNGVVDIVAIAASTGGPVAVSQVLSALPPDFSAPILVVQHMPATFTKIFASQLQQRTRLRVKEAASFAVARPGEVWIAPGDSHLMARRHGNHAQLELYDGPAENGCRPAADVLLRSLAKSFGAGTLVVVLTGMGQDALAGAQQVRQAGGDVWAQDEASSVVWGMPGAVTLANLATRVLPLKQVSVELCTRVSARGKSRGLAEGGRP